MTNIPQMKFDKAKVKIAPMPAEQYDILTLKIANQMKDAPNVKLLATHIAEIATILDRMKFHAATGWEDQATICVMATMRMMAQLRAQDPMVAAMAAKLEAANDNNDDMKMAA